MKRIMANYIIFTVLLVCLINSSLSVMVFKDEEAKEKEMWKLFQQFKIDYNKNYQNIEEEAIRYMHFVENLKFIETHRNRWHDKENNNIDKAVEEMKNVYDVDINQFSDLTKVERESFLSSIDWLETPFTNSSNNNDNNSIYNEYRQFQSSISFEQLPLAVDWSSERNILGRSIVTPVQNQGMCGACWAFVAAEAVEATVAINTGSLKQLSVQQLIDCDHNWDKGCLGGNPLYAYLYIKENGLTTAALYPYKASEQMCRTDITPRYYIDAIGFIPRNDELALLQAVYEQPVAVGICGTATSFMFYSKGIYNDLTCDNGQLNHAILIVGYGIDEITKQKYWLAKNSWGTTWGEKGYIRLLRTDSSDSGGICGLTRAPTMPLGGYRDSPLKAGDGNNSNYKVNFRKNMFLNVSICVILIMGSIFLVAGYIRKRQQQYPLGVNDGNGVFVEIPAIPSNNPYYT